MKNAVRVAAAALLAFLVIASVADFAFSQPVAKPAVEARCYDTGGFAVSNLEDRGRSVTVKKSGGAARPVEGSWREMSNGLMKFTSDDMAVVDVAGGYYTIGVEKKSYGVACPPFKFSCKLINLTINSCYRRNGTFFGKYTAYSFRYDKKSEFRFEKPFMLTYEVVATAGGKKKELTHSPVAVSPDFDAVNITRIRRVGANTYTLKWQTPLDVSRFKITYDDCETAKFKFYDSFDCTTRPSCVRDSECLQGERCDDSLCIPISCAACQYISNHACVDYDCCGDEDCGSGFVCGSERNCRPLSCGFSEYVSGHGCAPLECGEDEYAFNNSCSRLNCQKGQVAVNHICKDISCGDNESLNLETNSCQKLKCGFMKAARAHKCVSMFSVWFGRNA